MALKVALGVRESQMAMNLMRQLRDPGLSVIMIHQDMQHVLAIAAG